MSTISRQHTNDIGYLRRDGEGAPLVLLHGIGSNAQSFAPLIAELPAQLPLLAWEAPGYGESRPLASNWPQASDYAESLAGLLAKLNIGRFVLLGHSLGTLIAARLAAMAPDKVVHLILISPTLGYGAPHGGPMPAKVAARIEDLDRLGPQAFADQRAANLVADPQSQPAVVEAVRRAMADVRRPGYDQAVRMLASGRLLDDLKDIRTATTIIVGSRDRTTPPEIAQQAFAALSNATSAHTYREVPDAAHAICQEQPRVIAQLVMHAIERKVIAHA
jgi:pimeloyl-ACP methyl ester carboxylesterase